MKIDMKAFLISLALLISIGAYAGNDPELKLFPDQPKKTAYDENFLLPNGFFNINYNLGFGVGDFKDFISEISYRGFSLDARWFVTDHIAVGGLLGWNGFYEKYPKHTYEFKGGAVTGVVQTTYYNFTMSVNGYYYPMPESIIKPYVGLGIGPVYQTLDVQIGRYYSEEKNWQFFLAPEAGFFIAFGEDSDVGANLGIRYNYITYKHVELGFDNGISYFQGIFGLSFMF
jgi:hypothetical protein